MGHLDCSQSKHFVVIADEQTAGRGTRGRVWASPNGGLWLTIAYPITPIIHHAPRLGFAVLDALQTIAPIAQQSNYQLKWPNDILINQHKVAGILVESAQSPSGVATLIGVGVNLNAAPESSDTDTLFPPTALSEHVNRRIDPLDAALRIIESVVGVLAQPASENAIPKHELVQMNQVLLRFYVHSVEGPGLLGGVEPDGSLNIKLERGSNFYFRSGDLRYIRPAD